MSLLIGGIRLGLRCDLIGCRNTFRPRRDDNLRSLAAVQNWHYDPTTKSDFCCREHAEAVKENPDVRRP